jgi:hypothetical protein
MAVITGPLAAPHPVEVCYGSRLHCFWHEADEAPDGFRFCFECKHMFVTPADLLAEHNMHQDWHPATDTGQVFCCPLCTHDW